MFRPTVRSASVLSRPIVAALPRGSSSAATFVTSSILRKDSPKAPSIGELPPDSQEKFEIKLHDFREKQEKLREQTRAEAKRKAAEAKKADDASAAASASSGDVKQGGVVSKLFYGSAEAQQDTLQLEESHSKVLARGKYVHELVFHRVKPDMVDEYMELIGKEFPRRASDPKAGVKLVGSWNTEIGEGDVFGMFNFADTQ